MKLIVSSLSDLDAAIKGQARSDYIYMYPPRQAYRTLNIRSEDLQRKILNSTYNRNSMNIYIHVPFCRQICGFCNLYTTNIRSVDVQNLYVESVLKQIEGLGRHLPSFEVPTIYFGGGTPTVLEQNTLGRLITGVLQAFPKRTTSCEIAIEVDPQTATPRYLEFIRRMGINRINLGLQTRNDDELKAIGRRYRGDEQWTLATDAMSIGFDNVCIDLIYGLPGQTIESWRNSIKDCIELNPHTICCYPLTSRPHTGFERASRKRSLASDYAMWEFADSALSAAGFERQTHVRWARLGGGYLQKEMHWGLQNLFGFGAGARSYLWDIDLRSGYSIDVRRSALDLYMANVSQDIFLPREGVFMNQDERLRKAIILGLHDLNADNVASLVGSDPLTSFNEEFTGLAERGLLHINNRKLCLTLRGMKYRDLIVQLFFSKEIRARTLEFTYNE